jgi:hypothetical protein
MSKKERILFGMLLGSFASASVAVTLLVREYGNATSSRNILYSQLLYLISVMGENDIDVELVDGLIVITRAISKET